MRAWRLKVELVRQNHICHLAVRCRAHARTLKRIRFSKNSMRIRGARVQCELSFLADRYKQMQGALKSRNLFKQRLVADYSFAKSLIFAKVNLPKDEFKLFNTMFQMMAAQLPQPEVIAILDPGRTRQEAQIVQRGRDYEQNLPDGYLDRVAKGYAAHYKHHRGSRVLWVDTSALDFVARPEELTVLRDAILTPRKPGIHRLTVRP